MQRASTNLSAMSSASDEIDLATIIPADHQLPSTHAVQALNNRYIHPSILRTALEESWPGNWGMVTKLSYHVVIVPRELTKNEIKSLQRKSAKLMRATTM